MTFQHDAFMDLHTQTNYFAHEVGPKLTQRTVFAILSEECASVKGGLPFSLSVHF